MRDVLTTALDLIGFGLLTKAGFLASDVVGFAVAGGSVLFVSFQLVPKAKP